MWLVRGYIHYKISIHAPRGGSDCGSQRVRQMYQDFNPRSPWGERLLRTVKGVYYAYFNPRSPWGERPAGGGGADDTAGISIHAPRGGSDTQLFVTALFVRDFNPRSPWGERRPEHWFNKKWVLFQSTLPVGGATGLFR